MATIESPTIIIGTVRYRRSKLRLKENTTFFICNKDPHRNHLFKYLGTENSLIIGQDIYNNTKIPFTKKEISGGYLVLEDGDNEYPIHFKDYPTVRYGENWSGRVIAKPCKAKLKDKVQMVSGDRGEIVNIEETSITILLDKGLTTTCKRSKFTLISREGKPVDDNTLLFKPESQV